MNFNKLLMIIYYRLYNQRKKRFHVLAELINKNKLTSYLEIGTMHGDTVKYLLDNCPSLERVIGIDPYKENAYIKDHGFKGTIKQHSLNVAFNNIQEIKDPRFKLITEPSLKAVKLLNNKSFDLIFIDGDHSYKAVKKDIKAFLPKVKKGGYLTGHDYTTIRFGVIQAVNESFGVDGVKITDDYVWIREVKK